MVRLFMRLLLVAAWTYLCTVVVSVEKPSRTLLRVVVLQSRCVLSAEHTGRLE